MNRRPARRWTGGGAFGRASLVSGDPAEGERGHFDGRIAQLVEQLTLNQRVQGSSPCAPTNEIKDLQDTGFTNTLVR
jgi:hypothetical protein